LKLFFKVRHRGEETKIDKLVEFPETRLAKHIDQILNQSGKNHEAYSNNWREKEVGLTCDAKSGVEISGRWNSPASSLSPSPPSPLPLSQLIVFWPSEGNQTSQA